MDFLTPCPKCGGTLNYEPGKGHYCESCGTKWPIIKTSRGYLREIEYPKEINDNTN